MHLLGVQPSWWTSGVEAILLKALLASMPTHVYWSVFSSLLTERVVCTEPRRLDGSCLLMRPLTLFSWDFWVHSVISKSPAGLPKRWLRRGIVKRGSKHCLWATSNLQRPKAYEFGYQTVHLKLWIERFLEMESTTGMMNLFVPIVHYFAVCSLGWFSLPLLVR